MTGLRYANGFLTSSRDKFATSGTSCRIRRNTKAIPHGGHGEYFGRFAHEWVPLCPALAGASSISIVCKRKQ